jgi:hypothetical protein
MTVLKFVRIDSFFKNIDTLPWCIIFFLKLQCDNQNLLWNSDPAGIKKYDTHPTLVTTPFEWGITLHFFFVRAVYYPAHIPMEYLFMLLLIS